MQHLILNTPNSSLSACLRGCAVLTLCLALAACKPSVPEASTTTTPAATAPAAVEPVAAAPVAAAPAVADTPAAASAPTPAAPSTDTVDDEDMDPGLDDSYNIADFRPSYAACLKASDAVMPEVQACQDEELAYQEKRLSTALARINAGPDGYFKDEVGNWQAQYMRYTNLNCGEKEKNGPVGEGQSCFMNRYANRADALEALADIVQPSNAKPQ